MASYANQVEVLWIESFPAAPQIHAVVLDAQKVPATSTNAEVVVFREMERVTVAAPSASRVTLPFAKDLDTWAQSVGLRPPVPTDFGHSKWTPPSDRQQCVVILDDQDGILFRSPWFTKALPNPGPPSGGLPPGAPADGNGFIDVLVPDLQITNAATLNAELATRVSEFSAPPADPSLVVTSATVTLGSGELTLTASGTRSSGGFTYTLILTIGPSEIPFIWKDESGPLRARRINASVSFVAGPGRGFETEFLTLFSPWFEQALTPVILEQLTQGLMENARNEAARLAFGMPAELPPEVVISVRRIRITNTGVGGRGPGIYVWGAIGSFGRLLGGHLPRISTGSGSGGNCVVSAVLAPLIVRPEVVDGLRRLRAAILLKEPAGRRAVALYNVHSREMTSLLAARPRLACWAADIVGELADDLRENGRVSMQTKDRTAAFAHVLVPLASPCLRRDIEQTLRDDLWTLMQPNS